MRESPHRSADVGGGGVAVLRVVYSDIDWQSRPRFPWILSWRIAKATLPGGEEETLSLPDRRRVQAVRSPPGGRGGTVPRDDSGCSQTLQHRRMDRVPGADSGMSVRQLGRGENVFRMDGSKNLPARSLASRSQVAKRQLLGHLGFGYEWPGFLGRHAKNPGA